MKPDVILRARNDMPRIVDTIDRLQQQRCTFRLIAFDNASTDGTREFLQQHADRLIDVPEGGYVPGRVLNQGMSLSTSDIVVFLNSDCPPIDDDWLDHMLAPFDDAQIGAVFGRQIPREDCLPLFAFDVERTYGDGSLQERWRHCFSMAASAVRRSVWKDLPFDESLSYSEDIDWSWRARNRGCEIRYVPHAVVEHSHNYTLRESWRRHRGEGAAEARIFEWSRWRASWLRYTLLPLGRGVLADWRHSLKRRSLTAFVHSPGLRLAQCLGRRAGFRSERSVR